MYVSTIRWSKTTTVREREREKMRRKEEGMNCKKYDEINV
jgi:hypothetical protein